MQRWDLWLYYCYSNLAETYMRNAEAKAQYLARLARHEQATDLLIANKVLKSGDHRTFTSFLPGQHDLSVVVCGYCIEEYMVEHVVKNIRLCDKYDHVTFYFVDLEADGYVALDVADVSLRLGRKLPSRPEQLSSALYPVNLVGLLVEKFEEGPAR